MDFATQRTYYNRCHFQESLAPDDARNLDIDGIGPQKVRGSNWVETLARKIEFSDPPVFLLFTGLPGSGKSTELRRLIARLSKPPRGDFLPVLIDGETSLDLTNPVDIPDVIAAILFAVEEAVLKAEGRDPEQAMMEGYFTRLWNWLTQTDLELGKGEFTVPGGPKLVAEMRTRPSLRGKVRSIIASHLSLFLKQAREELELLEARARQCGHSRLVVIFDSLEKLRGTSENWEQVLASAERIFAGGAPHLHLPVHVLYTIPTALVSRRFEHVSFLPMIKLANRDGTPFPPGFDAARELVRRRVPDNAIAEILGPDSEARIAELIHWSGGYPREIVRLLQLALAHDDLPLSQPDFERIFNELKDAYRKIVPADAFDWLAQVATEQYYTVLNNDHRQIADQMLLNNAVLRYVNGNDWFDLHPAVAEIPGVKKARAALAQAATPSAP
ncbi:ABC transporter ATP-binding protein [Zoogloea sp.]|uniref:ATP-binding cassette domain-containing protein n=1 Tax=Zoogloea sp. TaxID=49181 RepID=UPI0026166FB5|nr:ABC transporter ATP-binding protein [Zoogloea sp.]